MTRIWTVREVLDWTTSYLEGLGFERPRFESEFLLASSLGFDRLWLYTHYDQPLVKSELSKFRSYVIRRSKREPLQYIIGRWGFWSLDLAVSHDVLIPRQETEHLVEFALKLAKPKHRILDLCTGSGNIVISLAKELPLASFFASDINYQAVTIARRNAYEHKVFERIKFFVGDLFAPFKMDIYSRFDLILCNPPYIPTREINQLQPEVKDFEPKIALDGGDDGLSFYRRLVPEAVNYLNPSGFILMEIGFNQAHEIKDLLKGNGYSDIGLIKDYAGTDRVIYGRYSGKN